MLNKYTHLAMFNIQNINFWGYIVKKFATFKSLSWIDDWLKQTMLDIHRQPLLIMYLSDQLTFPKMITDAQNDNRRHKPLIYLSLILFPIWPSCILSLPEDVSVCCPWGLTICPRS